MICPAPGEVMVTFSLSELSASDGEAPSLSFAESSPLSPCSMHPADRRARNIASMMISFMEWLKPLIEYIFFYRKSLY
jgi:hypothetical protein